MNLRFDLLCAQNSMQIDERKAEPYVLYVMKTKEKYPSQCTIDSVALALGDRSQQARLGMLRYDILSSKKEKLEK